MLDFFEDFVGFELDLDDFREIRRFFSIDEWIDIILGAIDYTPAGFSSKKRKLAMMNRLLPFVQNNLHLMELAPKGTGKSCFFGKPDRFRLDSVRLEGSRGRSCSMAIRQRGTGL